MQPRWRYGDVLTLSISSGEKRNDKEPTHRLPNSALNIKYCREVENKDGIQNKTNQTNSQEISSLPADGCKSILKSKTNSNYWEGEVSKVWGT